MSSSWEMGEKGHELPEKILEVTAEAMGRWFKEELAFEPKLTDLVQGVVGDQVDAAINHIFGPRTHGEAATYFTLTLEGLAVEIWEGDYTFVIPWARLGGYPDMADPAAVKAAFNKWFDDQIALSRDEGEGT